MKTVDITSKSSLKTHSLINTTCENNNKQSTWNKVRRRTVRRSRRRLTWRAFVPVSNSNTTRQLKIALMTSHEKETVSANTNNNETKTLVHKRVQEFKSTDDVKRSHQYKRKTTILTTVTTKTIETRPRCVHQQSNTEQSNNSTSVSLVRSVIR